MSRTGQRKLNMPTMPTESQFKKKVLSVVQKTQETKQLVHHFDNVAIQDPGRTPFSIDLIDLGSGAGASERMGNRVTVTGYHAKLTMNAGDGINNVRIIIYIPKNPTATLSTLTYSQAIDLDSYTVLHDKIYPVSNTAGMYSRYFTISKKFNKKGKAGMHVHFSGTGSTDFEKNRLRLYVVGDSGAIPDPYLAGHIRVYYKDS